MFFRSRFILAQLILILALGASACGSLFGTSSTPTPVLPTSTSVPPTPTPPPSVAEVDGEYITQADFDSELSRYKSAQQAMGKTVTDQDASKAVLDDMIAQVLLAQGAEAEGFHLTDADVQSRVDALTKQLGSADALSKWESAHGYTDELFRLDLKRSAEAAWMRDKIVAAVPSTAEQVHLQQILTYNQDDANAALEQLKGGADFADLAAQYDPVTHGELGWVPRGYLLDANVETAAFSLDVGAYSDVISTPSGFHIIKVLERDPNHPLSPDALLALQETALQNWVQQKRAGSKITLAP
ncbi:MAG TPA: peptidyl-prolyl cis-trans isomerase [Anaerolineales bacterium]|nr:peptidyl-prolyl cis-trans isomerase [Anaerolineales bacterium]